MLSSQKQTIFQMFQMLLRLFFLNSVKQTEIVTRHCGLPFVSSTLLYDTIGLVSGRLFLKYFYNLCFHTECVNRSVIMAKWGPAEP